MTSAEPVCAVIWMGGVVNLIYSFLCETSFWRPCAHTKLSLRQLVDFNQSHQFLYIESQSIDVPDCVS